MTTDLPDELLQTVALLPATPSDGIAPCELEDFDVCVSPLAVALHVLASACELQDAKRVFLVSADAAAAEDAASGPSRFYALSRGLLHQHGIQTTTLVVRGDDEGSVGALRSATAESKASGGDGNLVIVAARKAADATALVNKLIESGTQHILVYSLACYATALFAHLFVCVGAVASESVIVVCEESASPVHGAVYNLLPSILKQHLLNNMSNNKVNKAINNNNNAPQVLSLADLSDDLLASVRVALRSGHTPHTIQQAIYATYGPQKALLHRQDAFSDISKSYI